MVNLYLSLNKAITCISLFPFAKKLFSVFFLAFFTTMIYCQPLGQLNDLVNKAESYKSRVIYDSALLFLYKADSLLTYENNLKGKIKISLNICDINILERNYALAFFHLNQADSMIKSGFYGDTALKADYLQIRGSYFLATGQQDSSKSCLYRSIRLRQSLNGPQDTLLHYAFNKLGNLFLAHSLYDSAYICHWSALDLALLKSNPVNYLSASSYQNLGIAAHLKGDFNMAESCYTKSLKFKEKLFPENDAALAKIYGNLGKFYADLSKYNLALEYFDKAEKLLSLRYNRDDLQFAFLYWNKGNIYTHQGDFIKSTSYLLKTYSIFKENLENDNPDVLKLLLDIGFAYDKIGDNESAIEFYTQATKNQENAIIIKAYRNLGNIYNSMNNPDSANKYYLLSIENANHFYSSNSYDLALCYQYYGEFLSDEEKNEDAFRYINKASSIFKELFGRKNKDLSATLLLQGEYFLKLRKFDIALEKAQSALISLLPEFEILDPQINPSKTSLVQEFYVINALNLKAKVLQLRYLESKSAEDLKLSLNTISLSEYVIGEIRKSYNEEESQIILNNFARLVIDMGVDVSYRLYEVTGDPEYLKEAFKYSEKGHAIILLSALRGLQAQSTFVLPEGLTKVENGISSELGMYSNFLYEERQKTIPDEKKLALWNDKIFSLRYSMDSLLNIYKERYPEYFRLKFDYSVISSDSALNRLTSNQAILEYYLTDSTIFSFILTDGILEGKKINEIPLLKGKLDSLQNALTPQDFFNPGQGDLKTFASLSHELYGILIKSFENKILNKRLIIIPDGELGYLSFDILLSGEPEILTNSYSDLPWLLDSNPISYSSSATIFFERVQQSDPDISANLLAFAPSYDQPSDHRSLTAGDSLRFNLNPINGTKEEISSISRLFSTRKLFDNRATESNFKKMAGNYGILHLAMHTVIDNQNPLYSKLIFSAPDNQASDDGYLNTYELFDLKLHGQLAVLSACNTGGGKLERGEGIISLARGFFYAGIPSVVMTLWEIEDHSSADLMALFYKNLKDGMPNDIALQQAKISYMKGAGALHAHPYFWAGYVNIGKTDPVIAIKKNIHYNKWILTGLIILVIGGILYFFSIRRVFFRGK